MPFTVRDRVGHYDVTALVGEGGMGQVYQATDTTLTVLDLESWRERFGTADDLHPSQS